MTTSPAPSLKRAAQDHRDVSPPRVKRTAIPGVKQKIVANFFKPVSQKEPEKVTWSIQDKSFITAKYHGSSRKIENPSKGAKRKIAAFDFDSTLIVTKSGRQHSQDASDWQWWHKSVPGRLRQLNRDNYLLAIVSNQGGINLKSDLKGDKKRLGQFKQKAVSVFNQLDIPISLYAATEKDVYRKPSTGMWRVLLDDHALTTDMIDMDESVFVGDAAGRPIDGPRKADFSCSDRNFANNLALPFQTPEEYFLGEQPKPFERTFEPSRYVQPIPMQSIDASPILFSKKHKLDLLIFVGSPGSGKSTFYKKHLAPLGYQHVNQDILKNRDKCVKAATEYLASKELVAVDNTNRDKATRKVWIDLAKSFKIPIRCIYFTADPALCQHNDAVRAFNQAHNPDNRSILPGSAFSMYRKAFEPPEVEEGFEDITQVDFVFEGTDEEREVWAKYWT